jgi:hypothetical protein
VEDHVPGELIDDSFVVAVSLHQGLYILVAEGIGVHFVLLLWYWLEDRVHDRDRFRFDYCSVKLLGANFQIEEGCVWRICVGNLL